MNKKILENVSAHNKVYRKYEASHGEIYNDVEQSRLKLSLERAVSEIKTKSGELEALDFGCGAGNLTQYLLQIGLTVTAADVSVNFLKLVKEKYSSQKNQLKFLQLNGTDLSNVKNDSFDFIALYSVLHHVPDYLGIVKEFVRVLKPGGVLYIDHEASPSVWENDAQYNEYSFILNKIIAKKTYFERFTHLFIIEYWVNAIKEFLNPRYKPEGDIHVFQDDHIEWNKIRDIFDANGLEIVCEKDYLLFTRHCTQKLYNKYKEQCNDIRLVVVRKRYT